MLWLFPNHLDFAAQQSQDSPILSLVPFNPLSPLSPLFPSVIASFPPLVHLILTVRHFVSPCSPSILSSVSFTPQQPESTGGSTDRQSFHVVPGHCRKRKDSARIKEISIDSALCQAGSLCFKFVHPLVLALLLRLLSTALVRFASRSFLSTPTPLLVCPSHFSRLRFCIQTRLSVTWRSGLGQLARISKNCGLERPFFGSFHAFLLLPPPSLDLHFEH